MLKVKSKKLPTHLCVGTRKSGTTWIWAQLLEHPDVSTAKEKEIYFFNEQYHLGPEWYKQQFDSNKIVVDMTPDYFNSECAKRIRETLPWAKVFVCLRNPIERAFSHFKFGKFIESLEEQSNFLDVWNQDWERIKTSGLYSQHLNHYQSFFSTDDLMVVFYDDMKTNPELFMSSIYHFLDVPSIKSKHLHRKVMPGKKTSWDKVNHHLSRDLGYADYHRNCVLTDQEKDILKNYYKDSITKLEKMTSRDLTHWLNF